MSNLCLHLGLLDLKTANAWTRIEHDARNSWFANLIVFSEQSRSCFSRWKICLRPWGDKTGNTSTLSTLSTLHLVFGSQDAIYLANVSECHINGYRLGISGVGICQVHCNFAMWRIMVRQGGHSELEIEGVGSGIKLVLYGSRCSRISRWSVYLMGVINFLWDGTGSRIGFPIVHTYIISFTWNLSWNAGKPMFWKLIKDFGSWHEL